MRYVAAFIVSLALLVQGAIVVRNGIHEIPHLEIEGVIFLRADSLRFLGFRYVPAGTVGYLMYGKHTLKLKSDGTVIVDFIDEEIEGGCFLKEDGFYISSKVLKRYVDLNWYRTPDGAPISVEPAKLESVKLEGSKLVVEFSGTILKDMVDIEKSGKTIEVSISPVSTVSTSNIDFELKDHLFKVTVETDSFLPPEFSISENVLVVDLMKSGDFFGTVEIEKGLVWRRVREEKDGREYIVNYLDVDLNRFVVKPIVSKNGIGTLESVGSMVRRTKALAGVNASYFDPKTGMILGLLVKDGKVLSGRFSSRPVFYITSSGATIRNDYMEIIVTLNDVPLLVKGVNTLFKGEVLMYTSEFSKKIPLDPNKIYLVLKDGKIVAKGFKGKLEKGEYLVGIDSKYSFILSNVKVGDPFEIFINSNLDEDIIQAVEAGPLLIEDGAPLEKPSNEKNLYSPAIINSRRARTIVAVKDRKHITFIIVEDSGKGMDYNDMVRFLVDKGYEYAMCLDGGSSSSLVIKGRYVNLQDGEREPLIAVGLLVFPRR